MSPNEMTPERIRSVVAIILSIALSSAFDLHLFSNGKIWTLLQYETFLPLILPGQRRQILVKHSLTFLLINSTKLLFYEFGLIFELIAESSSAVAAMTVAISSLATLSTKDAIQGKYFSDLGILLLVGCAVADKKISGDKLFSSYLLPQMKFGQKPYPSINPLKNQIEASVREQGAILVVWESLGWPKDSAAIAAFKALNPNAAVQHIEHEGGSTLTAEMRYLCGSNAGVMDYADCVPQKTQSEALHGNALSYFPRRVEYPKMGFKQYYGRQELIELTLCHYAYNAACESDLIDRLIQSAQENQCKGLFYALTIDSHFPYNKYQNHVHDLLEDVSSAMEKLKQVKQAFPGCNIVVIGDHPPPVSTQFDPRAVMRIDIH